MIRRILLAIAIVVGSVTYAYLSQLAQDDCPPGDHSDTCVGCTDDCLEPLTKENPNAP